MSDIHEYRVREVGDGRDWKDIPVIAQLRGQPDDLVQYANNLASDPQALEVRHNSLGSYQGHYVVGQATAERVKNNIGAMIARTIGL